MHGTWLSRWPKCTTDSDGDGRTNGEELQINCNTMDIMPGSTDEQVTHPGILYNQAVSLFRYL